jgi:transposase
MDDVPYVKMTSLALSTYEIEGVHVLHEMTRTEWSAIAPFLPVETGRRGRPSLCNKRMMEGIFLVMHTGLPWMLLPAQYGNWNTVYRRFWRWRQSGLFRQLEEKLEGSPVLSAETRHALALAAHGQRCQGRPARGTAHVRLESASAPRLEGPAVSVARSGVLSVAA